jgi:leucyl/phenylalanyl-tRNA--protein transferase
MYPQFFQPPEFAPRRAPLLIGGKLSVEWLRDAYSHGIFPWPDADGTLTWWSPDPRPVIEFPAFHVPRRLARVVRSGKFQLTCDLDFAGVIEGCATAQDRRRHMWLFPYMRAAYKELHRAGLAHSVEAWFDGQLVGGVYGVAVGAAFSAESMFYRVNEASKVALVHLVRHLQARGYTLLDIQQLTPHTLRFGATEIPRREFLARLRRAVREPVTFGSEQEGGDLHEDA